MISVLMIIISLIACNAQGGNKIDTKQFIEMAASDSVKVIDVRTAGEIASGYISEADYFFDVNSGDFADKVAALDKNVTYLVYCRSGIRSSSAIKIMTEKGFTKLYDLSGGISSWQEPSMIKQ
ncbi:MAG: rhodanese-like domain-containing protein [Candidatus Paceibacterota bacterium]